MLSMTTTKFLAGVALAAAAFGASACSAQPAPAPTVTATTSAPAPQTPEDAFKADITQKIPLNLDLAVSVQNGRMICTNLSKGQAVLTQGQALVASTPGFTYTYAGIMVFDAVKFFCPQNQPIVDAFQRANGY
jgi:ABC-type glycerol-3-phosphate transport system substrate-binding protein